MRKQHAIHNEELCEMLLTNGKYNDWVVTTAFYSSLHLVYHEIFPLTVSGITYTTFDQYYSRNNPYNQSKHKVTIYLVGRHLSRASAAYRWLYDACMTARYNNYSVQLNKATAAKSRLEIIKAECPKP